MYAKSAKKLADFSYTIYLTHFPVLLLLRGILDPRGNWQPNSAVPDGRIRDRPAHHRIRISCCRMHGGSHGFGSAAPVATVGPSIQGGGTVTSPESRFQQLSGSSDAIHCRRDGFHIFARRPGFHSLPCSRPHP